MHHQVVSLILSTRSRHAPDRTGEGRHTENHRTLPESATPPRLPSPSTLVSPCLRARALHVHAVRLCKALAEVCHSHAISRPCSTTPAQTMALLFRNMFIGTVVAVLVAHAAAQCDCDVGQPETVSHFCTTGCDNGCGTCGGGIFNGGHYCWCGSDDDLCEGCPNYVAVKASAAATNLSVAHGVVMACAAVVAWLA